MKPTIQTIKAQKLEWHPDSVPMRWDKKEFDKYAKSLGKGWRVPSRKVLFNAFEDKVPGFKSGYYWSSTTFAGYSGLAWFVYFYGGSVFSGGFKDLPYFVRCVRSIPG